MTDFKVGDEVCCIDNTVSNLLLNEVYRIFSLDSKFLFINEFDSTHKIGWRRERFVLAKKFLHDKDYQTKLENLLNDEV